MQYRFTPGRIVCGLFFIVAAFTAPVVLAQSGSVDTTFTAVPTAGLPADINFQQLVQPDGKILVYGAPSVFVSGELRSGIFRLNADGSLDPTFNYCNCGGVGVGSLKVAPDGKIVIGGTAAPNHGKMIRLNADGSLDNSFSVFVTAVGPPELTQNWFTVNAIQADGKVIATHGSYGNIGGTWYSYTMRRYNLDASVDSSFVSPPLEGGHLFTTASLIELLPDGRFYLCLSAGSHLGRSINITRRLANGTADPTYVPYANSIPASSFIYVEDLALATDGGLLASGVFWPSMLGGPYVKNLFKFLPSGAVDPGFNPPLSASSSVVHVQPDGKVLYSVVLTSSSPSKLIRLATDGSIDNSYVVDPSITSIVNRWQADSAGRPIFLAQTAGGRRLVRLLENGSIDPSFNPSLGSPGTVSVQAVQADGKVVMAGSFSQMNGVARNNFARVNADGSLDTTLDPGTGFSSVPLELLALPDGKTLAMGSFDTYNGAPVARVVRLNSNGSIDGTFNAGITANAVLSASVQSDGKIVVVGNFSAVNGIGRTGIARLDANGALDESFNPVLGMSAGGIVTSVVAEPNGKITFAGRFSTVNGISRVNFARVDSTGATDTTFNAGGVPQANRVYRQPDGKYVTLDGTSTNTSLSRRNSDGTPDSTFVGPIFTLPNGTLSLTSLLLRPDGSMLVGGSFSMVGVTPRSNLVRLAPNGPLDTFFLPTGTNAVVRGIAAAQTGKVVIAGAFTTVENVSRVGIARLNVPDFRRKTPFDFNGDGRSDITVYRPSSGVWYELFTNGDPYAAPAFGLAGDIPVPADYDGDGRTDLAIFRPSTGTWWWRTSSTGQIQAATIGQAGDIPLPSDVDGDGVDNPVLFRPSTGMWVWATTSGQSTSVFGIPGDIPVIGDFDGDGKADRAIFRPSTGDWWYAASASGFGHRQFHWGANGDVPAAADFDGDGKTDFAVFRPSNGGWYILRSSDLAAVIRGFGVSGDRPVVADYDGDGRADIAVFRPSDGIWYLLQSTAGSGGVQWGIATDVAIPNAFTQP